MDPEEDSSGASYGQAIKDVLSGVGNLFTGINSGNKPKPTTSTLPKWVVPAAIIAGVLVVGLVVLKAARKG
jgi:hypothetical protein